MRLLFIIISLYSLSAFSGVAELWFKHSGISCENSIELNASLVGSNENLIGCFNKDQNQISSLNNFIKKNESIRSDLETWLFIQNASKLVSLRSKNKFNEYKSFQNELKSNHYSYELARIEKDYILLKSLNDQKKYLEEQKSFCSKIQFWKTYSKCDYKNFGDLLEKEISETENAINLIKESTPLLGHPYFDKQFEGNNNTDFKESFSAFLPTAISEISGKIHRHGVLQRKEISHKNIEKVLNNQNQLSEILAAGYTPETKYLKTSSREYQSVNLNKGLCRIHQSFNANAINSSMKTLGKDIALLALPFAVIGKVKTIFKGIKSAQKLMAVRKAKGVIVGVEALTLIAEDSTLRTNLNECKQLQSSYSHYKRLPDHLKTKVEECEELTDAAQTSYILAVIGGTTAAKLSTLDVQDIRLDRIYSHGKGLISKTSGTVKATLIKQLDNIYNHIESMVPTPQMATAGVGDIDSSSNQFIKSTSIEEQKSPTRGSLQTFITPQKSKKHIFDGEFTQDTRTGSVQYKLSGGMHTKKGLNDLIEHNKELAKMILDDFGNIKSEFIKVHSNGVTEVLLPRAAFNKGHWRTVKHTAQKYKVNTFKEIDGNEVVGKTLFPNNWNDSDIMKAIKQITKSPNDKYFIEEREAFEYIGEHRGVKMMVIINKDNELQTAYPLLQ